MAEAYTGIWGKINKILLRGGQQVGPLPCQFSPRLLLGALSFFLNTMHASNSIFGAIEMTRWAVIFKDTPEMLDIRADRSRRDAHVAYVQEHPELLIGGGLKPDIDADFCGAMWIVEAQNRKEIEQLIEADPFYVEQNRSYEIFTWGKILEDKTVTL